jgi:hypothetical protein
MNRISAILRELLGLFVNDGSFASAILLWLALALAATRWLGLHTPWLGPTLAAGLALILLENLLRTARCKK